jgi:hypothetical protein
MTSIENAGPYGGDAGAAGDGDDGMLLDVAVGGVGDIVGAAAFETLRP